MNAPAETSTRTVFAATSLNIISRHWTPDGIGTVIKADIPAEVRDTNDDSIHVEAGTLSELISMLGERQSLTIDDIALPGDGEITSIGYSRVENGDLEEPTASELDMWKAGKIRLFHCTYWWTVEKRTVSALTKADFDQAGLKTHSRAQETQP
jgi:hypothetical protein